MDELNFRKQTTLFVSQEAQFLLDLAKLTILYFKNNVD